MANEELHTISKNECLYEICIVPTYKSVVYKKSTDPKKTTPEAKRINETIQTILNELQSDNNFHERLHKNDVLKLNIDLDDITFKNPNTSFDTILNNICEYFKISLDDISYTTNKSVKGGSHHIVIPKYYMPSINQKPLWEAFKKQYNLGEEVDCGHLGTEKWFRLPNQTKQKVKNTEHIIQKGKLEDFVLKYIPSSNCTEFIENISGGAEQQQQQQQQQPKKKTRTPTANLVFNVEEEEESKEPNSFQELLMMILIDPKDRNAWLRICACIKYNNGSSNEDWKLFAETNNLNWDEEKQNLFNNVKTDKDLNDIYYLQQIAKKCNPEKYKKWLKKWNIYSIDENKVYDAFAASKIIFKTLKHTLRLCKETWYMLTDNQLWKSQKEPSYYIVQEINKYLDFRRNYLNNKISSSKGEEKKQYVEELEKWLKLYSYVSRRSYVQNIASYLKTLLVDDKFSEKLDCNKGKLAFKNGIMDLETKKFREGIRWDDFLTDTIPYEYKEVTNCTFVKDKLKQILNNDENHLEYHLSLCGASFIGCPELLKAVVFHIDKTEGGRGDNGKSFWFDILHSLMPNYVYRSKSSFLDNKNQKNHKQIAQLKGKRLLYLEEMPKKQDTNYTLFKEIADGKTIENEKMFGTCENISILCIFHALSNHIPDIDAREEACYNRYRQISYNSHFDRTGTRKENNPEKLEFIADTELATTIKNEHYDEVFNLIIDYAHRFYINKRKLPEIPEQFKNDAKETKENNDKFGCWFRDNIKIDASKNAPLKLIAYLSKYNEKDIKDEMKRKGFKYNKDLYGLGTDYSGKSYRGGFQGVGIIDESQTEI